MMRVVALLFVLAATTLVAQEPGKDPDSFEIEPPVLIPNRDAEKIAKSDASAPRDVDPSTSLRTSLAKLEKEFERAKRNIAGLEKLVRIGALSKLEAEQRILRCVHLEFDLANARLLCAKEKMLEKEKQLSAGEIAETDITPAENNLALAIEAAHAASLKRERADIDAAEANVHRQEKLLVLGSARKKDVDRAMQKLAELKSQKD